LTNEGSLIVVFIELINNSAVRSPTEYQRLSLNYIKRLAELAFDSDI